MRRASLATDYVARDATGRDRMKATFTARFAKGYIADPYWPAREKAINITKESGVNRARTEANRERALRSYLEREGLTQADYDALLERAARPFYTVADVDLAPGQTAPPAEIVIPQHHVNGCLVAATDMASAALRVVRKEQVRSVFECSPWLTGKTTKDGDFERFATVTGAQGKLSNQRALRSNPYIANVSATGSITFDEELAKPEKVHDLLTFAGRESGIGACRKLGWGRFTIEDWFVE